MYGFSESSSRGFSVPFDSSSSVITWPSSTRVPIEVVVVGLRLEGLRNYYGELVVSREVKSSLMISLLDASRRWCCG